MSSISKANFLVRKRQEFTWRDLEAQWKPLTVADCEAQLLDAEERVRMKKARHDADKLIVAMGPKVLRRKQTSQTIVPPFIRFADDTNILTLDQFEGLDAVEMHVWNVNDGTIHKCPIMDWLSGTYHKDRVLLLSGDSDVGKSCLARSMLARLAEEFHTADSSRPYFIEHLTVDALSSSSNGGWCQPGKPILLDEIRPRLPRGSRPPMSVDELKKLLIVSEATTLDARNKDIQLSVDQPRIITSNAMSPHDWYPVFPPGLLTMSDAERKALDPDAKAVGKRICWACVVDSLVPQSIRDGFAVRGR